MATLSTELPHKAWSEMEKESWKSLKREIKHRGAMVVTDHDQPVAVVLSVENYETLARLAQREQARIAQQLADLRARLDQQLAVLKTPQARQALDTFMDEPVILNGQVSAGDAY